MLDKILTIVEYPYNLFTTNEEKNTEKKQRYKYLLYRPMNLKHLKYLYNGKNMYCS